MNKKDQVKKTIQLFKKKYPDAHCALDHASAEQLLIATILSAQCTDERVNKVTPQLFKKYPTLKHFARVSLDELAQDIRSTGFFNNKAKNIISCAQQIIDKYQGHIPQNLEEFTQLAGVGRKTANVVLGNAYNIASGVVVDTHVTRLSNRMGLVKTSDAVKIERALMELVPQADWIQFSHWMIHHGRVTCKARKPDCEHCFLNKLCPKKIDTQ